MIIIKDSAPMQSTDNHRTVEVASIKVANRHRREMGDLQGLAASIDAEGLLQPIGVTENMELVFGERRLRAIRDILKRDTIDVRIVKVSSIVAGEMAENEIRKDFTPSERVAIAEAVRLQLGERRGRPAEKQDGGPTFPERPEGQNRDIAAQRAGFGSGKQLERAENVVRLGVPKLVEKMDTGEVTITAAAKIARAEPAVQEVVVKLAPAERREAIAKISEDGERARRVAEEQEKRTGPTAFTGFLKKNGRYPDAAEAETIAKLDYRATPDSSGKRHEPVSKEQLAARKAEEKLNHLRFTELWRLHQATQLLASNKLDPAETLSQLSPISEPIIRETLEQAFDWISRFRKEWLSHVKKSA